MYSSCWISGCRNRLHLARKVRVKDPTCSRGWVVQVTVFFCSGWSVPMSDWVRSVSLVTHLTTDPHAPPANATHFHALCLCRHVSTSLYRCRVSDLLLSVCLLSLVCLVVFLHCFLSSVSPILFLSVCPSISVHVCLSVSPLRV